MFSHFFNFGDEEVADAIVALDVLPLRPRGQIHASEDSLCGLVRLRFIPRAGGCVLDLKPPPRLLVAMSTELVETANNLHEGIGLQLTERR